MLLPWEGQSGGEATNRVMILFAIRGQTLS
jgi:hypothetical protein